MRLRDTMDWETFTGSGFRGRDIFLDMDLAFDPAVNDSQGGLLSQNHPNELVGKARNFEKTLPAFNRDITLMEKRAIQADKHFIEVLR